VHSNALGPARISDLVVQSLPLCGLTLRLRVVATSGATKDQTLALHEAVEKSEAQIKRLVSGCCPMAVVSGGQIDVRRVLDTRQQPQGQSGEGASWLACDGEGASPNVAAPQLNSASLRMTAPCAGGDADRGTGAGCPSDQSEGSGGGVCPQGRRGTCLQGEGRGTPAVHFFAMHAS
jgi:hypothetical protein